MIYKFNFILYFLFKYILSPKKEPKNKIKYQKKHLFEIKFKKNNLPIEMFFYFCVSQISKYEITRQ